MMIPSRINGIRTNAFVAPMYFIMAISSRLIVIPMDTVLLMRNIETARRMAMITMETIVISRFIVVSVFDASADCLTERTPSSALICSPTDAWSSILSTYTS